MPKRALISFLLLCLMPLAAAALTAGDRGYGLTVFSGNKIERFDVEILGLVENNQLNEEELRSAGRSWLIRVGGEAIVACGGISQGMSGSPIYVNEKLVGAVASSWSVTDHTVGLMTPIEEMRELYQRQSRRRANPAMPRSGPLFVSGLRGESLHQLRRAFQSRGYTVRSGPAMQAETAEEIPLVPGQAVAILLARGDINVFTIGTLTEVRSDGRFLALGHAFMKRGAVHWFLSPARIHHTFDSAESSFKMGVPLAPKGSILQDRNAGVMGKLGKLPHVVHLKIDVEDRKEGEQGSIQAQIVRDPFVLSEITSSAVIQSIDRVADRELRETLFLRMQASLRDLHGETWQIERSTRGGFDDPRSFLDGEIHRFLGGILDNPQLAVQVDDIHLQVIVDPGRAPVQIREIHLDIQAIKGENLVVRVELENFRGDDLEESLLLPIPVNLPDGEYDLVVEAGDNGTASNATTPLFAPMAMAKQASFATYLQRLAEEGRGDRLRVLLRARAETRPPLAENPSIDYFQKHRSILSELARSTKERRLHNDALVEEGLLMDYPVSGPRSIGIVFGPEPTETASQTMEEEI